MRDTYVICANIAQENNIVTGYLATDKASGGYPYFSTSINNSEIRTFESVEAARKFIETDLKDVRTVGHLLPGGCMTL